MVLFKQRIPWSLAYVVGLSMVAALAVIPAPFPSLSLDTVRGRWIYVASIVILGIGAIVAQMLENARRDREQLARDSDNDKRHRYLTAQLEEQAGAHSKTISYPASYWVSRDPGIVWSLGSEGFAHPPIDSSDKTNAVLLDFHPRVGACIFNVSVEVNLRCMGSIEIAIWRASIGQPRLQLGNCQATALLGSQILQILLCEDVSIECSYSLEAIVTLGDSLTERDFGLGAVRITYA